MAGSSESVDFRLTPRAQDWLRLMAECAQSGLTQAAFCAARGISRVTMSWWRRELRLLEAKPAPAPGRPKPKGPQAARFVAVRVRPTVGPAPIEIVLAGGRVIRIVGRFEESELRRVIAVLESITSPC
jgi:hypothetical protein